MKILRRTIKRILGRTRVEHPVESPAAVSAAELMARMVDIDYDVYRRDDRSNTEVTS